MDKAEKGQKSSIEFGWYTFKLQVVTNWSIRFFVYKTSFLCDELYKWQIIFLFEKVLIYSNLNNSKTVFVINTISWVDKVVSLVDFDFKQTWVCYFTIFKVINPNGMQRYKIRRKFWTWNEPLSC